MTALYSVNLHVMGRSNIPLVSETTFTTVAETAGRGVFGGDQIPVLGWQISARDASVFLFAALVIPLLGAVLYLFFRTNLGTAMRATGDNDQMIRALGVSNGNMVLMGLALSNGLIALSGALLAQYQGFADVQMGIGMVVWGLASVIIGEALVGTRQLGFAITGAVMGSVLFRLLVAIALRWGLNPNDLKLITAIFVFLALILPGLLDKLQQRRARAKQEQTVHA
jgi:putative ABC transport system permease protein